MYRHQIQNHSLTFFTAPSASSLLKNRMNVFLQPPHSPDLGPGDFFLFSKLKLMVVILVVIVSD